MRLNANSLVTFEDVRPSNAVVTVEIEVMTSITIRYKV